MKSILILLHCESNTGYAIGPLENTFFEMARSLCDDDISRIHFAYPSMRNGPSSSLPESFEQYAVIDARSEDLKHCLSAEHYLRKNNIDTVFGFDQPVNRRIYRHFRRAGVRRFISYWGAPMSSINGWLIRALKRLEVGLHKNGPDHYIFESKGMAEFAVLGRGIAAKQTSIVPLGVDIRRFRPNANDCHYVYKQLNIPEERKIFFYAGHMEARKGVAVIMRAANILSEARGRSDWHIVICGNKPGESAVYEHMLSAGASRHVTFGGYRADLDKLCRGCYAAMIMSTGWDSFPRSALEVQASGLPLLVSDLRGISESVEDGETGLILKAGDAGALAAALVRLLEDPAWRDKLAKQARARIENKFTLEKQLNDLIGVVRDVV